MSRLLAEVRGGRAHGACNSLIDDFIPATVAGLREDGWLQELGKRAAWSVSMTCPAAAVLSVLLLGCAPRGRGSRWMLLGARTSLLLGLPPGLG